MGKSDRIKKVFKHGVKLEFAGTGGLALTVTGIRIYALSIPFMGLNSIIMYYFQAQEKTGRGLLISLLSGSVLPVLSLMFLIRITGRDGIWSSFVTAQVVALGVSLIIYAREKNTKN